VGLDKFSLVGGGSCVRGMWFGLWELGEVGG
jgi:hypothetical protein